MIRWHDCGTHWELRSGARVLGRMFHAPKAGELERWVVNGPYDRHPVWIGRYATMREAEYELEKRTSDVSNTRSQ